MAVAGFVVAAVALVLSVITWLDSRKSAREANQAAERAASAAERSAAADEQQAALARKTDEQYAIPWRLEPAGGDTWRLTNANMIDPAYDVTVEPVDSKRGSLHDAPQGATLGPGDAVVFFGIRPSNDQPDSRVKVWWRRTPEGDQLGPWIQPTG